MPTKPEIILVIASVRKALLNYNVPPLSHPRVAFRGNGPAFWQRTHRRRRRHHPS